MQDVRESKKFREREKRFSETRGETRETRIRGLSVRAGGIAIVEIEGFTREIRGERVRSVNSRGISVILSFSLLSLSLPFAGKKENEQLSGGHFVFPARCAVLICPVNPGLVLERSVPAAGGQRARGERRRGAPWAVRTRSRVDDVASGNDRSSRQVTSGEVRLILTGVCMCVYVYV